MNIYLYTFASWHICICTYILISLLFSVMTVVKSRYSGKEIVILDDYTYYCKRSCKNKNSSDWYCSTHNSKGCNARMKLNDDLDIIEMPEQHNHPPGKYCIKEGLYVKLWRYVCSFCLVSLSKFIRILLINLTLGKRILTEVFFYDGFNCIYFLTLFYWLVIRSAEYYSYCDLWVFMHFL